MVDFHKTYMKGSAQYNQRKSIFEQKLSLILSHNSEEVHAYKKGINDFTDMSDSEFKSAKLGYSKTAPDASKNQQFRQLLLERSFGEITPEILASLPINLDWREKQVVSPVKD